jgi:signal transduction histidine kinase/DNA-binding response OmpR family regulator
MTPDNKKSNILIVDDLPEKLLVMETILDALGQNIILARSGEEALLQVLQHDLAVILLDVHMPSMDGYETAALIRQRRKSAHTPIIFITSFADEVHKAQGYSLGAVDYVLAPVNPDILRTKVRVFVELFQMAEQAKRHADERVALVRELAARQAAEAAREAAEAAHRRSSFLAEASATMARSLLDDDRGMVLAKLPVPFLCDESAVVLRGPRLNEDDSEQVFFKATDGAVTTERLDATTLPTPLLAAIKHALATSRVQRLENLQGQSQAPAGAASGLQSALVLPLRARDQILGVLALALGPSGRRFGPTETLVAEDLAERAAVLLDNGRLYRNIQEEGTRKNEFLAMLAHELRNPLAAIQGAVQVLQLSDITQDKVSWARTIVERQVNQLVRLVDDLLDVARITQGKIRLQLAPVNVASVIDLAVEMATPFIDSRRHHLFVSRSPESLYVNGDVTRLSQVLANLLNNAAKYTDPGGEIRLYTERDSKRVLLRVRDTGIGIPAHLVSSIFDMFTQANHSLDRAQGGLGIGLTLVRQIVEMHGGTVSVTSKGLNQGSEFLVSLPLLSIAQPQTEAAKLFEGKPPPSRNSLPLLGTPAPAGGIGRRVLVVDDNRDIAESLAFMLEDHGNEVRTAHDGPSALNTAAAFCPEIVLLDIGLPGIDGYEVARRLRKLPELSKSLLVALTGYGQSEARHRAQKAGFDIHLVKPVDFQTLSEVLSSARPPGRP